MEHTLPPLPFAIDALAPLFGGVTPSRGSWGF